MFVQHIVQFIEWLQNCNDLHAFDSQLLDISTSEISYDPIFWKNQLILRWEAVKDTSFNYAANFRSDLTMCWIQLSYYISLQTDLIDEDWSTLLIPISSRHDLEHYPNFSFDRFYFSTDHKAHCIDDDVWNIVNNRPLASYFFAQHLQEPFMSSLKRTQDMRTVSFSYDFIVDLDDAYDHESNSSISIIELEERIQWRILSLSDLKILRDQKAQVSLRDKVYPTYWECIQKEVLSVERYTVDADKYPHHLLPALICILDEFFLDVNKSTPTDLSNVHSALFSWSKQLQKCSNQDTLFFFKQTITINNKKIFFLDVILDLFGDYNAELPEKVLGLAKKLYLDDPSLVGRSKELQNMYVKLWMPICPGDDRGIFTLKKSLKKLSTEGCDELKDSIEYLIDFLSNAVSIETITQDLITELFTHRELALRDSALDIKKKQDGVNAPWITLARLLSGSGLLYSNYFSLLMPIKPLSFTELLSIRQKNEHAQNGSLYFNLLGYTFENFCIYLDRSMQIPSTIYAEIPRVMVVDLFLLLDLYSEVIAEKISSEILYSKLVFLDKNLQQCAIDDANLFNIININVDNENCYLIEILLDLYQFSKSAKLQSLIALAPKMQAIAAWIVKYDYSLVAADPLYSCIYQDLKCGTHFSVADLFTILISLRDKDQLVMSLDSLFIKNHDLPESEVYANVLSFISLMNELIALLITKDSIDYEVINSLRVVYKKRELLVSHSILAYTGTCKQESANWIVLAQKIAGLGVFQKDYKIIQTEQLDSIVLTPELNLTIFTQRFANGLRYRFINPLSAIVEGFLPSGAWLETLSVPNLLQRIADCGHVYHPNYYGFILPRLQNMFDNIYWQPITNWALSHCVLNSQSTELCMLSSCVVNQNANGQFYINNNILISSFKEHLFSVPARYLPYINQSVAPRQDEPLYYSTILLIYEYVKDVLFIEGLTGNYNQAQEDAVYSGHVRFREKYYALPIDERKRLDNQWILMFGTKITFKQNFRHTTDPKNPECIALTSRYNAKLVIDYLPSIFNEDLVARCLKKVFEQKLMKKKCRDHDRFVMKIQMLFVSVFTYKCSRGFLSNLPKVYFLDSYNYMFPEINQIYNLLIPMIRSGDFSDASNIYSKIIHTIVNESLKVKGYSFFSTHNPAHTWLKSLQDESLFVNELWYDPIFLLNRLSLLSTVCHGCLQLVYNFLDEIIHIEMQKYSPALYKALVNIKFQQLCSALQPEDLNVLLSLISYQINEWQDLEGIKAQKLYVKITEDQIICRALDYDGQLITRAFSKDDLMYAENTPFSHESIQPYKLLIIGQLFSSSPQQQIDSCVNFIINRMKKLSPLSDLSILQQESTDVTTLAQCLEHIQNHLLPTDVTLYEYIKKLQSPIFSVNAQDDSLRAQMIGMRSYTV